MLGYYGWMPPTNVFPQQPPTDGVFMSDAPPPYPGIHAPGQQNGYGPAPGYGAPGGYGAPAGYGPPQGAAGGYPPGGSSGGCPRGAGGFTNPAGKTLVFILVWVMNRPGKFD